MKITELDRKIRAAKDNLENVKYNNQLRMDGENQKRSSTRAQAEKDHAGRLERLNAQRRQADEEKRTKTRPDKKEKSPKLFKRLSG
ncbi:hypothetical protein MMC22_001143 [Lobaria immixta]|nr:hypothetical protein [Lobaria immixta]